ncbi:MAG: fibronectin type III domain-containing protein [Kofleriaceae bacterium]
MPVLRRLAAFALAPLMIGAPIAVRAQGNCTTVDVDFFPAEATGNPFAPQIVAWVEKPDGSYYDTIFITQQTGTFGLGNRPGRFDFNSGPNWPYGRRLTVFPVWSHRQPLAWSQVVFQNGEEDNLSHPFNESSREARFCRPLINGGNDKPQWDAMTCASQAYTDKGKMDPSATVRYPPRNDVLAGQSDDPIVDMFGTLNPFDAVSRATPEVGRAAVLSWAVPESMPPGDYVMWVEVSKEFDINATYNATTFPAPMGIPWSDYGEPYRGQPSVLYKVAFAVRDAMSVATTTDYVGYGDPDGLDGNVRAPDATITGDVPGSGATRLALISDGESSYRLRVTSKPQIDLEPPAAPRDMVLISATGNEAQVAFVAPGDDGLMGPISSYEIRYAVESELTTENFDAGIKIEDGVPDAGPAGELKTFAIPGLLPETDYYVGIRAIDDCRNLGPVTFVKFTTPERTSGEVDACFVATAAYGSLLAHDVHMLRRYRDSILRRSVIGELAVETYYTFGPALAGVVGESDLLRHTARQVLAPIVDRIKSFSL